MWTFQRRATCPAEKRPASRGAQEVGGKSLPPYGGLQRLILESASLHPLTKPYLRRHEMA
nr:hypothetical protein [Intestinirhabdus alba]